MLAVRHAVGFLDPPLDLLAALVARGVVNEAERLRVARVCPLRESDDIFAPGFVPSLVVLLLV